MLESEPRTFVPARTALPAPSAALILIARILEFEQNADRFCEELRKQQNPAATAARARVESLKADLHSAVVECARTLPAHSLRELLRAQQRGGMMS